VPEGADLLHRFKPQIRYDSLEAFFADSAAVMTDDPATTLRNAGGSELAGASSEPPLGLGFLASHTYPTGSKVSPDDRLSVAGRDYRTRYSRLVTRRPELRDRVYGHAVRDSEKRLWLQYWFFYFYNDYNLAARIGLHEGDWEMIQLRIDETREPPVPDTAVYAQHDGASVREWENVVPVEGQPDTCVVFCARGSHAAYFEPGLYDTAAWFDVADGEGKPRELSLEVISDDGPEWARWPGTWGDTARGGGMWGWLLKGAQSSSPAAPCRHSQWRDPKKLLDKATSRAPSRPGPEVEVSIERVGRRLRVSYDLDRAAPEADPPRTLVLSVRAEPDDGAPPRAFTLDVRERRKGSWTVPWLVVDASVRYVVTTSLMSAGGSSSRRHEAVVAPAAQRWRRTLLGEIGQAFARAGQMLGLLRTRLKLGS
jgi:hypothetical protein